MREMTNRSHGVWIASGGILVTVVALYWIHEIDKHGSDGIATDYTSRSTNDFAPIAEVVHPKEFVRPVKIFPPRMQYETILSNTIQKNESMTNSRSLDSGNFRHNKAEIWDHEPEYEFRAFGRRFHLILRHDSQFIHPELQVTFLSANSSYQRPPTIKPDGCFYSGHLQDEPHSSVAVSLCNGMTGHINSNSGSFTIEPDTDAVRMHETTFLHVLQMIKHSHNRSSEDDDPSDVDDLDSDFGSRLYEHEDHLRRKRSSQPIEYTIELMIVVDKNTVEFHGAELHNYILELMHTAGKLYKHKTIGNRMHIAVVRLVQLEDIDIITRGTEKKLSGKTILEDFCKWQNLMNDDDDNSPNHHDGALYIFRYFGLRHYKNRLKELVIKAKNKKNTIRENVCELNDNETCENLLGMAKMSSMCKNYSCAIVKDNGLGAAFTIAHELGHILNMPHDDEQKCKNLNLNTNKDSLMARVLDQTTHPWNWSACSRHYLSEYLDTGNGDCLLDKPFNNDMSVPKHSDELTGELFPEDKQCQLSYGNHSRACKGLTSSCRSLWCKGENGGCKSLHMPLADGTICAPNKWCLEGDCVPVDRKMLMIVDGDWGPWSDYGECSRSCGGGIKKSYRECNNPAPSNGGLYCDGKRVRFQSCNTEECPVGTPDFRLSQCEQYNNGIHNIQWKTDYFGNEHHKDRCKLFCWPSNDNMSYNLDKHVIDGTPCGPDTYDMCVEGVCRKAGCDHILDSDSVPDNCGICGGNNSTCKQIRMEFNESPRSYGYSTVFTIPAGASKLDITQTGSGRDRDQNYLAMADPRTNEYLFNGNFTVLKYRQIVIHEGVSIEYSGSDSVVERINTSKPLTTDLLLQVLSTGRLDPPDIVCEYTVPKQSQWEVLDKWTECNRVCYGEQETIIRCLNKDTNQYVPSESCAELPKPRVQRRICNENCFLRWKMISHSECSSLCGPGTRTLTYRCYQVFPNYRVKEKLLIDSACRHIAKPAEEEPCLGPCDEARWKYYEWQACSGTCGTGIQTRRAECVDELERIVDESKCALSEKIVQRQCTLKKCPQWSAGLWSSCSVTCGTGEKRRHVHCQQENRLVPHSYCRNERRPHDVEVCQADRPCPKWITGEWSKCSVSCGFGMVVRTVRCSARDQHLCPEAIKPSETERCILPRCVNSNTEVLDVASSSFLFVWKTAGWSHCSVSCGVGFRKRSVDCYNRKTGKSVDRRNCDPRSMPSHTDSCIQKCPTWETTEWTSCSATCGVGIKWRNVRCIADGSVVFDSDCSEEKPANREFCESNPCPTTEAPTTTSAPAGIWRTGRWGECSVTCGGGTRMRVVACQTDNGTEISNCDDRQKPETTETCNHGYCPSEIKWKYGDWSECNQTCGGGYQHRQAQCYTLDGENIRDSYCSQYEIPFLLRSCDDNPCAEYVYKWKNSDWSECSSTCNAGIQTRTVSCERINKLQLGDSAVVEDQYCTDIQRPPTENQCFLKPCPVIVYRWSSSPWNECSCKTEMQFRSVYCEKIDQANTIERERVVDSYCSESSRPTVEQRCSPQNCAYSYTWIFDSWEECSCKTGLQTRRVYCQQIAELNHERKETVNDNFCDSNSRPAIEQRCSTSDCPSYYKWIPGSWSECSCKTDTQSRSVHCEKVNQLNAYDREVVVDSYCSESSRPIVEQGCSSHNCAYYYTWIVHPWNECSCKTGKQTRLVFCQKVKEANPDSREIVNENLCELSKRPLAEQNCSTKYCPSYYTWSPSSWSECSCKTDTQFRSVRCARVNQMNTNEREWVADSHCSESSRPITEQICSSYNCAHYYVWNTESWNECSCNTGLQMRNVYCQKVKELNPDIREVVNNDLCDINRRPSSEQQCVANQCSLHYTWVAGPWSECSHQCGKDGLKRRKIYCSHRNGDKVNKSYCKQLKKPRRKRKCNRVKCGFSSCMDVKQILKVTEDKEYSLKIRDRNISIYCHDMASDHPVEFVSLLAGESVNYSEFFGKRLVDPDTCPQNWYGKYNCPCIAENSPNYGLTMFKKIRLNITTLQVITKDFTFATQKRGNLIAYGEAGDCYSRVSNCTQGQFSIDLTGTGLRVASSNVWISSGAYASKYINWPKDSRKLNGKCGGYCAVCKPRQALKLDVLPP